jgi:uncharacterized protein YjiS (DUF1127 family)
MMTTQTLNAYGATAGETGPVGSLFARVAAWIDGQRRYRRTVYELSQLTDRELEDIGLSRAEIGAVAKTCAHDRG